MHRRGVLMGAFGALLCSAPFALAQAQQILVIDTVRVYQRSKLGTALRARNSDAARLLETENQRLVAELEAEELDLTNRRAAMDPEAFQKEAIAFDQKVQRIRQDRDAKQRKVEQDLAALQRRFSQIIQPVVEEITRELGASMVVERNALRYHLPELDITQRVIDRLDASFDPADAAAQDQ